MYLLPGASTSVGLMGEPVPNPDTYIPLARTREIANPSPQCQYFGQNNPNMLSFRLQCSLQCKSGEKETSRNININTELNADGLTNRSLVNKSDINKLKGEKLAMRFSQAESYE